MSNEVNMTCEHKTLEKLYGDKYVCPNCKIFFKVTINSTLLRDRSRFRNEKL